MFELMPFENMLSVLVLSGAQVQDLCDQLAEKRGEPIAGFSFRIESEGRPRVAGTSSSAAKPLDPDAEYRLVTNDYMANGGELLRRSRFPDRPGGPTGPSQGRLHRLRPGTWESSNRMEGRISGGIGR